MGCEFALPFVFPPYFADTYGGKEDDFSFFLDNLLLIRWFLVTLR